MLIIGVIAGCSRPPGHDTITRIAVVQTLCDPRCRYWSAVLTPDRFVIFNNEGGIQEDNLRARIAQAEYARIVQSLLRSTFYSARTYYARTGSPQNTTWITVSADHSMRSVGMPSEENQSASSASIRSLQFFVKQFQLYVEAAIYQQQSKLRGRLENLAALTTVEYTANGCFGSCPAYTVRFSADNRATIREFDFVSREIVWAIATIPFDKVRQLLEMSRFTQLERRYPIHWIDVSGGRLKLVYRDGFVYESDGPDSTQWSAEFQNISNRIDQLVLDTPWNHKLPARR